ncbi:MAG: nucleoside triphosphate pyrophosphohydrolase [Bacteroidales bacterium]|nr:nucleoside triphosphate pyrophosphohydrolase [Bacteroidales bacterium]
MTSQQEKIQAFERLLTIMNELREQCPWDREQTFESLRHLTIEETYELSEAILDKDIDSIKKELGDLMLHLVFYAKIGTEKNSFDIGDVIQYINDKLVFRHPHIYGDVEANDAKTVKDNWEKLKLKEGRKSVLSGVPVALPPLVKAYRIQEKAKGVGFDWEKPEQVWDKVLEEMEELKTEVDSGNDQDKMEHELGDLLFALVNYARFIGVNPEDALERTNRKFISRFMHLEKKATESGRSLKDMTLAEMDVFWEEAKKMENIG